MARVIYHVIMFMIMVGEILSGQIDASNDSFKKIVENQANVIKSLEARISQLEKERSPGLRQSTDPLSTRLQTVEKLLDGVNVRQLAVNVSDIQVKLSNPLSAGDSAWVLTSSALVLMMTIPGLALFYGGMVRVNNVLSTVMQSFSIVCLITVLWMCFGYSLSFTTGSPLFGGHTRFWLLGMSYDTGHVLAPTIPEPLFMVYELMFAIITPALICGAFADRMRFSPMLLFMALWHLLVYCPIAHAHWMTDGFLKDEGILDFAGGNVVHVAAGCSGLMASLVIGSRTGYGKENFSPHNILVSVLGASLLWVGWFGFNAGSYLSAHKMTAMAMAVTQISTAVSALAWMCTEWIMRKRPSVLGIISGAVAGLVAITPGAGYVDCTGAFFFGLLAGPVCYFVCQLKHRLGYDDALDAFGIHGPGGVVGGIMTGLFATEDITGKGSGHKGAFYGKPEQLYLQLYGILFAIGWSCIGSLVLLKLIDAVWGLRVAVEEELMGLDIVCHGEYLHGERIAERESMDVRRSHEGMPEVYEVQSHQPTLGGHERHCTLFERAETEGTTDGRSVSGWNKDHDGQRNSNSH